MNAILKIKSRSFYGKLSFPSPSPPPSSGKSSLSYLTRNIPTVQSCPSPSCSCQETPKNLDIDYKRALDGTVAPYSEHILVHTARNDWPSKIEQDEHYPIIKALKEAQRRTLLQNLDLPSKQLKNVLITTFASARNVSSSTLSLLKSGVSFEIDSMHLSSYNDIATIALVSADQNDTILKFPTVSISDVTILICGHDARDSRCGTMGPILEQEFQTQLSRLGIGSSQSNIKTHIGMISHIGGHAFAGNVIIYIPRTTQFSSSSLAGLAVWYGRVQPKHVEGIIRKTILEGVVIEELRRGSSRNS